MTDTFTSADGYITLADYWMGRDKMYPTECTPRIRANAANTVVSINKVLRYAATDGVVRKQLSSGWRPSAINDATGNAAKFSNHIVAKGGDVVDNAENGYGGDRALQMWCLGHANILARCGVWIEDPDWCAKWNEKEKRWDYWVHMQTVPPKSGKRIYIPNTRPPTAPQLLRHNPVPDAIKA